MSRPSPSSGLATLAAADRIDIALAQITPVVLTWNEAPNLARCLERLKWAGRVVVVDSLSSDDTIEIARRFPNVEVHERAFDNHAAQWNHGLSLVATPWALSLDADYLVPEEFVNEAERVVRDPAAVAAFVRFRYCISGRPLRASLYPPRPVLFRPNQCRYEMDGHTQRLVLSRGSAPFLTLDTPFDHDDRKPFGRWLESQDKYSRLEAEKLSSATGLTFQDRLRRTLVLAPPAVFLYSLIVRGALFDGWRGWYYTLQRTLAEVLLSLHLVNRKFRRH